eukprot:Partr_v1_DN26686_c1_g1_i2_m69317 putative BRF1 homolog, subunit of RNA polymerase III transcription initiation factor IIIB (S. cerevisiae)
MPCPNCPGAAIEYDNATGSSYCTQCGAVLEESTITSELTFMEGGDGSARMVGQFVSAERSGLRSVGLRNRRMNTGQSREETIANARRKFQEVAIALKGLGEYHIERAVQCYKLALMHGFTNGRKQAHVIAACLYAVCRQEKTMHMLIDFADVLHTNLFVLGCTFLKLIRLLNIRLPLIDPSLYLSRFASALDFGDKTQAITTDALRLVQRMKRDWIHYGRRPSGICGACLLIASRMHGCKRSQLEIIRVVKICDQTLRLRLAEFSATPSARMSIDDFRNHDLSTEANPPCYQSAIDKVTKAKAKKVKNGKEKESASEVEDLDEEMTGVLGSADFRSVVGTSANSGPVLRVWKDQVVDEDPEKWGDISDGELDHFFLTADEITTKTLMWEDNNRDWIVLQEAKKKRELEISASSAPEKKRRKPMNGRRPAIIEKGKNPKEAIKQKMAPAISKKINYAALDQLFE